MNEAEWNAMQQYVIYPAMGTHKEPFHLMLGHE
jgi:hypothetical protein